MEDKKLNNLHLFLTIILFGIVCILTIYIVVDRNLRKDNNVENVNESVNENVNESVNENVADRSIIQNELNRIAEEELYVFGVKKNINELTNREKIWFAFVKSGLGYDRESFAGKYLMGIFNDTAISGLGLNLDNILYYHSSCVPYEYNLVDDSYKRADECAFSYDYIKPAYVEISDYTVSDEIYSISVKYLWAFIEPADKNYVFDSYSKALDYENFDYSEHDADKPYGLGFVDLDDTVLLKSLVKNNDIETYNFSFNVVDGKFKLIDFHVN